MTRSIESWIEGRVPLALNQLELLETFLRHWCCTAGETNDQNIYLYCSWHNLKVREKVVETKIKEDDVLVDRTWSTKRYWRDDILLKRSTSTKKAWVSKPEEKSIWTKDCYDFEGKFDDTQAV